MSVPEIGYRLSGRIIMKNKSRKMCKLFFLSLLGVSCPVLSPNKELDSPSLVSERLTRGTWLISTVEVVN